MTVSAVVLIRITREKNSELKNYQSKQVISQEKSNNMDKNKNLTKYSDLIHLVNKYKGQIKSFKTESNSLIDADIIISGNKEKLSDFIGELRKKQNLRNINSICLGNQSDDSGNYSLEVDVEFSKSK
jgi:malonyl CoA-acyl carrier protein transacylase